MSEVEAESSVVCFEKVRNELVRGEKVIVPRGNLALYSAVKNKSNLLIW